jgi:hypothetical protein
MTTPDNDRMQTPQAVDDDRTAYSGEADRTDYADEGDRAAYGNDDRLGDGDSMNRSADDDALGGTTRDNTFGDTSRDDALGNSGDSLGNSGDSLGDTSRNDAMGNRAGDDAMGNRTGDDALGDRTRDDSLGDASRNDAMGGTTRGDDAGLGGPTDTRDDSYDRPTAGPVDDTSGQRGMDDTSDRTGSDRSGNEPDVSPEDPLVPDDVVVDFRARWDVIQQGFVDDPRSAVTDADKLVGDVLQRLSNTFDKQHQSLEGQWADGEPSTEDLRGALQRYRAFFDRLLTL